VSFRARLVLAAAYLVTAVVLALEIPLALNVERRADADFQATVLGRAAILSTRVSHLVATASGSRQSPVPAQLGTLVDESARNADARIVVTDDRGLILADSADEAAPRELYATPERPEFAAALLQGRIDYRRRRSETVGDELLLVTVPVVQEDRVVGAVRVSASRASVAASVHGSWLRLALIGLAVVAATLVLAWILAGSLARPLARLRDAAGRLGAGDLDARASPEGPTELSAVAASFNHMADQLASNLRAQRDFIANASHQLRTPLTGVKLRLEAIRAEADGAAAAHAEKAEAEVERLGELVEDLLELARATTVSATGTTLDLADIADAAVERWGPPASDAGQTVVAGERQPARVFADPADLAHVVDNLIENALRYCPPGTRITVETASADGAASLLVADDGPGIAPEDRPRVFERFYRGSNGRRSGQGTGLGLAIVAELVGRWGGEVRLLDGPGTRVAAVFARTPTDR
jgi:two-component system, OmpR family, sensor kinase